MDKKNKRKRDTYEKDGLENMLFGSDSSEEDTQIKHKAARMIGESDSEVVSPVKVSNQFSPLGTKKL